MDMQDYYYYEFIRNDGNQELFWDAISSDELGDSKIRELTPKVEELILKRQEYVGRGPINRCAVAFLGLEYIDCKLLEKIRPLGTGEIYYLEWIGNLKDFNEDCILVDEYKIFSQTWLRTIAQEYNKALITVAPAAERAPAAPEGYKAKTEDAVGAKYEIIVYNPETGGITELFGEEYDCWAWAAQLSSLAFTANSGEINDKFTEYAVKYIGNKRCLAVPGNSGCHANLLIKSGWQLADCPHDIEITLDMIKEGE